MKKQPSDKIFQEYIEEWITQFYDGGGGWPCAVPATKARHIKKWCSSFLTVTKDGKYKNRPYMIDAIKGAEPPAEYMVRFYKNQLMYYKNQTFKLLDAIDAIRDMGV